MREDRRVCIALEHGIHYCARQVLEALSREVFHLGIRIVHQGKENRREF